MPGAVRTSRRACGDTEMHSPAMPQIKIASVIDIHGNPTIAFDKTTEVIEKGAPKADAFVCLEAIACPEVAEV